MIALIGTNEKVLLAIDQSYPVNDELRTYADYFCKPGDDCMGLGDRYRDQWGTSFDLLCTLACRGRPGGGTFGASDLCSR